MDFMNEMVDLGQELGQETSLRTIRIEERETYVRLISSQKQKWFHKYFKHWGFAKFPVTCKKSWDKNDHCPLCEEQEKPGNEGKNLQKRIIAYAMVGKETPEVGVVELPISIFKEIISLFQDPEYGDIGSFQKGIWLKIIKEGTGKETRYSLVPGRKEYPVDEHILEKNQIPLITEYLGDQNEDLSKYREQRKEPAGNKELIKKTIDTNKMEQELNDIF